jgi:transcription elongation factor Elf1
MGNIDSFKNYSGLDICEAIECNSQAKFKITLKVGTGRSISLFLCKNCGQNFCKVNDLVQPNDDCISKYDSRILHSIPFQIRNG